MGRLKLDGGRQEFMYISRHFAELEAERHSILNTAENLSTYYLFGRWLTPTMDAIRQVKRI